MHTEVEEAINLRKEERLKESNELLIKLAKAYPHDPVIQYQCAWSFDVLGKERQAIPYYESAIALGLAGEDLEGAFLGLGSTYRTIGEYEKSKKVFEQGRKVFPENKVLPVFQAMTLYNLNEHQQAMELLLNQLVETTGDKEILSYKRAISFYVNKLDKVWD